MPLPLLNRPPTGRARIIKKGFKRERRGKNEHPREQGVDEAPVVASLASKARTKPIAAVAFVVLALMLLWFAFAGRELQSALQRETWKT